MLLLLLQHSSAQHLTTRATRQLGGQAKTANSQQAAGSSQTARQPGQKLSHAMAKRAEFS